MKWPNNLSAALHSKKSETTYFCEHTQFVEILLYLYIVFSEKN